eukprot:scaffold97377_cov33-Tisochrysis_lutea.AAC.2
MVVQDHPGGVCDGERGARGGPHAPIDGPLTPTSASATYKGRPQWSLNSVTTLLGRGAVGALLRPTIVLPPFLSFLALSFPLTTTPLLPPPPCPRLSPPPPSTRHVSELALAFSPPPAGGGGV